jgi:hypothetical protein
VFYVIILFRIAPASYAGLFLVHFPASCAGYKNLHDHLDHLGKVRGKFVNFANFAMQKFA